MFLDSRVGGGLDVIRPPGAIVEPWRTSSADCEGGHSADPGTSGLCDTGCEDLPRQVVHANRL
jgi:hypothetical protein